MKKLILIAAGMLCATAAMAQGLSRSEADSESKKVWQQWQAQCPSFLPEIKPLVQADTMYVAIPEELEPNAVMPYFYGAKGDSIPSHGYPLYIYLHGSGPKQVEWANGMVLARRFDDAPSVYFIPQIPNEGAYYRWWQQGKQYVWDALLRQAMASGLIDPNRIYIFGISEGGYGSQRLASFYADYLAGAGPMAGGEPLKNAPVENLRHTAFSLLSGEKDYGFYRNRLTAETGAALDSIAQLFPGDYPHRVGLIPGAGHGIDYSLTTPWLAQHTRSAQPRTLTWEDFDMDGLHRTGFYNLYVEQRPEGERTRYDMSIDGNCVDLTIQNVEYSTTETDPHWGIPLEFARRYSPAVNGRITIFLSDELLNLDRPVTVRVNGEEKFAGMVERNAEALRRSCAAYGDPCRLFPAALSINY